MAKIHPMSVVDPAAEIDEGVEIGPFCVVGPHVKIASGTVLMSHVSVLNRTTIGRNNKIFAGACIGCLPQDKKYAGEDTSLEVGDDNVIRENCTMSIGTVQDEGVTRVGSRGLYMANVHVAHDCRVGNDVILANNVGLAGHVHVKDFAIIGGQAGVHQFVHIGEHAMVGGGSMVVRDVPPFVICSGYPAEPHGLNSIGLRRRGFTADQLSALKHCYRIIYRENLTVAEANVKLQALEAEEPQFRDLIELIRVAVADSPRGIIR
ncbi:acyl-ACP--UDP-N-acetylglucosamine O-acyltransferase [Mesosutterella sp. AGMB02718]|uniref:Acyl-[acyl-carrier-protein]--UDP-N-acetylglucosamine O-acyltransferase n=1 Tax=Mesosutterella faecium TaxID=2925194 RepID=A0ABT7IMN4_9BURK|nr:acyl-ACP--UDP-N-acetylglucosamine O-acyltransferase [Mesosutterella sp. AGMB02718]MDL2059633.1 acyl-ACP--UDP-N-acetylglucosamine O-acyltransferase [Mesosutterella sp. AGMB02718]